MAKAKRLHPRDSMSLQVRNELDTTRERFEEAHIAPKLSPTLQRYQDRARGIWHFLCGLPVTFGALLFAAIALVHHDCCCGQEVMLYQPTDLDLRIPDDARISSGNGTRVLVRSPVGKRQVAELLCRADDQLIILRPTGDLAMIPSSEAQPAESERSKYTLEDVKYLLEASGLGDYKMQWEKPFLFVYACTDPFYEYTKNVVRSMYAGIVAQLREWDLNPTRPKAPLLIVITPSRKAFDELKRMPPEVLAYYSVVSNHVVLYEDQNLADAAPEYALKRAAYVIAHEVVHQLLANTGIQKRLSDWPMWISEGIPEFLCPLRVRSKLVRRGSTELPVRVVRWQKAGMVNDLRMHSLLKLQGGDGALVRAVVMSDDIDSDGYAVAWGLVHHLAKNQKQDFAAYLKEVSALEPLGGADEGAGSQHQAMFVKHFGHDFASLERSVQKHLTSKNVQAEYSDPIVNQTHYLVKLIEKRGKFFSIRARVTTSPAAARAYREQMEKEHEDARFYTIICKSKRQADYELAKLNLVGR